MKKVGKNQKQKSIVINACYFVAGVFLLALCYNMLFLPNNLVVSGMSGFAIAIEKLTGFNSNVFIYISNVLLLLVSFLLIGYEKTKNTIIGSLLYPLMITFTAPIAGLLNKYFPLEDPWLIILFASVMFGISNGLIYKGGYTTGGNDVIMQLISKYFKLPESKSLKIVNTFVILAGALTFGYIKGIYSLIILLTSTIFVDKIMFGISDSKLFYIFTREEDMVKKVILDELESGFTILPTKGGYSHTKGSLIMCVVPNRDYYLFKERILEIDPTAFFIIDSCYEVNGGMKRSNLPFLDLKLRNN